MQPMPITTKVMSSNPVHCEVVSDLWQFGGFFGVNGMEKNDNFKLRSQI